MSSTFLKHRLPSSSLATRGGLRMVILCTSSSMDNAKPTVLIAEKLGDAWLALLKQFANVDCSYNISPEELNTKISLCDTLIVRSATKVSCEVFEASADRFKVVDQASVGIDNMDMAAATEHEYLIINTPTANTVIAAEHDITLLAAMARNVA